MLIFSCLHPRRRATFRTRQQLNRGLWDFDSSEVTFLLEGSYRQRDQQTIWV